LLVLFDVPDMTPAAHHRMIDHLSVTFRDTDVFGWFKPNTVLGAVLVELGKSPLADAREAIAKKIRTRVLPSLESPDRVIPFSIHILPLHAGSGPASKAEQELARAISKVVYEDHRLVSAMQRVLDICGSLFLLFLLAPVLLAIAACVRLTSPGPALFRQTRAGFGGRPFGLYKFRTMIVGNDDGLHQEYVKRFISGDAAHHVNENGEPVYKLTRDPRITPIGRFLRRSSLDELPQFWNVLIGDMSLVGPRPPTLYEFECYDLWHRRRVYEVKPGVTGVWQVRGRSRCTFDEMTRMDLQHAHPRSLGLYFRVLIETPGAVILGGGAH
jgi:lipopolysaccharide/colanic/teichoic acid biosynthesis glycosyltransferase